LCADKGSAMNTSTDVTLSKPDYGIDAPGLVKIFFSVGAGAFVLAFLSILVLHGFWVFLALLAALVGFYAWGMGFLMLVWSKSIKLRTRETIMNRFSWRGDERVLDVGCGRGLLLVAAAKRLTTGTATGIDIWRREDQSSNQPEATIENAKAEGVAERVTVDTGDMRKLPYTDESFDVVTSHWVVHNLSKENEQADALAEMHRVLKTGGRLVLADIAKRDFFSQRLRALGFKQIEVMFDPVTDRILRLVSGGSFCPATHYAVK
jgi:arsenite methyltransferase